MGTLVVTLSGICVNVFGYVPGVPMRTVLPDAMSIRFGSLLMPGVDRQVKEVAYYLMPHFAMVRTTLVGSDEILSPIEQQLLGKYISVANAIPQPFNYVPGGYNLGQFVTQAHPSPEVVLNGRALAYFDCFGGTVETQGEGNEPRTAKVTIETDGPPVISITSLPGNTPGNPLQFQTDELYISNLDVEPATEDAEFDFLLNYLVTLEGIPRVLTQRVPGLSTDPRGFTLERLGVRLRALGLFLQTQGTVAGWDKSNEPPQPLQLSALAAPGQRTDRRSALAKAVSMYAEPVPFDPSCSYGNLP